MMNLKEKEEEEEEESFLLEERLCGLAWTCPDDLVVEGAVDSRDVVPGQVEQDLRRKEEFPQKPKKIQRAQMSSKETVGRSEEKQRMECKLQLQWCVMVMEKRQW
jgi:hypothetical protein